LFRGERVKIVDEYLGKELVGLSYEPLYDIEKAKAAGAEKTWTIQAADFVTTEEGTGVVHIAPMYGEDDYQLGKAHGLPMVPLLDATGTYNNDAPELVRGMYFKKGGKAVTADLEERKFLFPPPHDHTHSYPHCYRCGTALIYNALTSWFIDIQSVKERLLEENEKVAWHPEHLKHGRFQNIVANAPDWTISRNRFWASPLPIWVHEHTGEHTVIGSLTELRERTKKSGNTYLLMRHGQAESNINKTISSIPDDENHLTDVGIQQATNAVAHIKGSGVTKIIASPYVRTRETALIVARELGIDVPIVTCNTPYAWDNTEPTMAEIINGNNVLVVDLGEGSQFDHESDSHGPVIASVIPGVWILAKSHFPSGLKVAPAHSLPRKSPLKPFSPRS